MSESISNTTDEWVKLPTMNNVINDEDYVRVSNSPIPVPITIPNVDTNSNTESNESGLQITIPSPSSSMQASGKSSSNDNKIEYHNSINKLSVEKLNTPIGAASSASGLGSGSASNNNDKDMNSIQWILNMLGIANIDGFPTTFLDITKLIIVGVGACTVITTTLMYVQKRLFSLDSKRIE